MPELTIQQAFDLALQHHRAGKLAEAEQIYRQILAQQPQHIGVLHYLGLVAYQSGQDDKAIDLIGRAIALNPNYAEAFSNLGLALKHKGQVDEAIAAYRKAISLDQNASGAFSNLGIALESKGQRDEAITAHRRAIQIQPDAPHFHWNLSFLLLRLGQFAEGWEEFEWRLKDPAIGRDFTQPQWDGRDLTGKTLLLHAEGGYGDTFNFIRYVPLLRGRAKKTILECQPDAVTLLSNLPGIDEIFSRGQTLPAFDYQIPLPGLPRVFKTDLTNIPNTVPYLKVPAAYLSRWKERVQTDAQLKVGLVWAGNHPQRMLDEGRLNGLDVLAPFAEFHNVKYFSLQKGPKAKLPLPPGLEITNLSDDLHDFADTAAVLENLDLMISMDTSVAHLAGALGRPVWTLLPVASDARFLLDRDDSPWYPTMRLFRQVTVGDWQSVIARVVDAFRARLAQS
jgi:Tetratricopeptide repeat/TPR repeat/Glycosyltransferase family 9 (heptosyltransferase)